MEKKNKHNFTTFYSLSKFNNIEVGNYSYGSLNVYSYNNSNEGLKIGSYVSIAPEVKFILGGGEHHPDFLLNNPIRINFNASQKEKDNTTKGPIIIEDDVWICTGATILSGVTIGRGSIIGAGSVVSKNVPPFSVFLGNKVVRQRFNSHVITKLMRLKYENLTISNFHNYLELLYTNLNENEQLVDKIFEQYSELF